MFELASWLPVAEEETHATARQLRFSLSGETQYAQKPRLHSPLETSFKLLQVDHASALKKIQEDKWMLSGSVLEVAELHLTPDLDLEARGWQLTPALLASSGVRVTVDKHSASDSQSFFVVLDSDGKWPSNAIFEHMVKNCTNKKNKTVEACCSNVALFSTSRDALLISHSKDPILLAHVEVGPSIFQSKDFHLSCCSGKIAAVEWWPLQSSLSPEDAWDKIPQTG